MNKIFPKFLFMVMATVGMIGCARDRENNPVSNVREAAAEPTLQGRSFKSECSKAPGNVLTGNEIQSLHVEYRFDGANVSRNTLLFPNEKCEGDVALTFSERGRVNIDKDQNTKDNAQFIDFFYEHLHVIANSDAGVIIANKYGLCNGKDWVAKQDREVTAAAADKNCYTVEVPRVDRNVYRLEDKTLLLGSVGDPGEKESERPTSIENESAKYTAN